MPPRSLKRRRCEDIPKRTAISIRPPEHFRLLDLPPELRLEIYDYVFFSPYPIVVFCRGTDDFIVSPKQPIMETNIRFLTTCRVIHDEAINIYHQSLNLMFTIHDCRHEGANYFKYRPIKRNLFNKARKAEFLITCAWYPTEPGSALEARLRSVLKVLGYGVRLMSLAIQFLLDRRRRPPGRNALEAVLLILDGLRCDGRITVADHFDYFGHMVPQERVLRAAIRLGATVRQDVSVLQYGPGGLEPRR